MASAFKKGHPLESKMGRPFQGSLSTFLPSMAEAIKEIRTQHSGWGADSILEELQTQYLFKEHLPSKSSVNRYLSEQGLIERGLKSNPLPSSPACTKSKLKVHDQWEMDAKGPIADTGIGHCAPINIKDRKSKLHCISFPVVVKHKRSQPKTVNYYWALRLAFEKWGLPKSIRVDHDSVFHENNSSSPFPKNIHLWLIGLGVEFCFIKHKPPIENAIIERSHQTIYKQVYKGCKYDCWKDLRKYSDYRVEKLNRKLPNEQQAPLGKYPKAKHSKRVYTLENEADMVDLRKVHKYLAKGKWFRAVSQSKTVSLGGNIYYLKKAIPKKQIKITFCNRRKKLMFHDVNEQILDIQPIKGINKESLMGGTNKKLISIKYKLLNRRDYPL